MYPRDTAAVQVEYCACVSMLINSSCLHTYKCSSMCVCLCGCVSRVSVMVSDLRAVLRLLLHGG